MGYDVTDEEVGSQMRGRGSRRPTREGGKNEGKMQRRLTRDGRWGERERERAWEPPKGEGGHSLVNCRLGRAQSFETSLVTPPPALCLDPSIRN